MAASAAAEAGVPVTVIDDNPMPGGQYYRQSPSDFDIPDQTSAHSGHPEAAELYKRLDHPNINVLQNERVWGVFEGHKLALTNGARTFELETDRVVLATGAYDRPLAFPGWTLPGVFGVGSMLRMIKTQWVMPGRRFLLVGLGPLQLALADVLLKSGAEVVCVAEATTPGQVVKNLPGFWGHWDRIREAINYRRALYKHKVPLLFNHAIVSASGQEQVESAQIARLDSNGTPIPGTERTFEVDTVCLGYGLLPSSQLATAFGCELRFDDNLQWFLPRHDANMETSCPGVFVAGDVTDLGGAYVAAAEGRVAGLTATHQLGSISDSKFREKIGPASKSLRRFNRFASALQNMYAFRPGLAQLANDDTVVCRCEEVRASALKDTLASGAVDLHQVKLLSRAGMGYCQGRICSPLVTPLIAAELGQPLDTYTPFTTRPPLQPIRMSAVLAEDK
jgi:thioredoxin reductase